MWGHGHYKGGKNWKGGFQNGKGYMKGTAGKNNQYYGGNTGYQVFNNSVPNNPYPSDNTASGEFNNTNSATANNAYYPEANPNNVLSTTGANANAEFGSNIGAGNAGFPNGASNNSGFGVNQVLGVGNGELNSGGFSVSVPGNINPIEDGGFILNCRWII